MRGDRGFSLIEMIIATGITAAVVGTLFAIVQPAQGAFDTVLEVADMQQRLRVAVDALTRDLAMAGAGAYVGGRAGPLIRSFTPVLPFRRGPSRNEAPGTFRADAITIISVPATAAQTTLAADLTPASLTLQAAPGPACAAGTNLCGFAPGMTVAVYDDTGSVDTFTIVAANDATAELTLAARPADSSGTTYDLRPPFGSIDSPYYVLLMAGNGPVAPLLALRAEAFGPRGAHAVVELTAGYNDDPGQGIVNILSWREVR